MSGAAPPRATGKSPPTHTHTGGAGRPHTADGHKSLHTAIGQELRERERERVIAAQTVRVSTLNDSASNHGLRAKEQPHKTPHYREIQDRPSLS